MELMNIIHMIIMILIFWSISTYDLEEDSDLSYSDIKILREKFIGDGDFIKKHNIAEYIYIS
jgi:hypothetical protein